MREENTGFVGDPDILNKMYIGDSLPSDLVSFSRSLRVSKCLINRLQTPQSAGTADFLSNKNKD